jgi:D-alanine transaminase
MTDIAYFNGLFLPKNEIKISPDDRGFLFADGVYEVVRWYGGFFFDMENHIVRLKRSLRELRINSDAPDIVPDVADELIRRNDLQSKPSMIYLQITRGAARRSHNFPTGIEPTVYMYAWDFVPDTKSKENGISVMMKEDIRWSRCDIKSVALLANTLSFQEACEAGMKECIFTRNNLITEGSHSNIFFVRNGILYTHPESNNILSGITRRNVIRLAKKAGIKTIETAIPADELNKVDEAFITNTSAEVTPVTAINDQIIGDGKPGNISRTLNSLFDEEIKALKG